MNQAIRDIIIAEKIAHIQSKPKLSKRAKRELKHLQILENINLKPENAKKNTSVGAPVNSTVKLEQHKLSF